MKTYKYSWSKAYSVKAQVVGDILQRLPSRSSDELLKAASDPDSPLHAEFDWDDTSAARKYRQTQARTMIACLRVEVINVQKKPSQVRAFIRTAERNELYVPILEADEEALTAEDNKCLAQMQAFKDRWKGVQIARDVINAIVETDRSIKRRKKAA